MTKTTHGLSGTSEHISWKHMRQRCFNPNDKKYSDYGGRGITVCDRWLYFEHFLADMGLKPTSKHSIDRIDNDGNYRPDNCRWATNENQANNRRSNRLITLKGETWTMAQWEKEKGFNEGFIKCRLKAGWSEEDAIMTPAKTVRLITYKDETLTISEWEKKMGYDKPVIANRLYLGWSEEDAITIPFIKRTR